MSSQIGNISIGSISNVDIGKSVNLDEYNIVDEDINTVAIGENDAYQVSIDFVVTNNDIIDTVTLEEQKERIKRISERKSHFNSFGYMDLIIGFISVEQVSFVEDSERRNLLEGTISGIFLPWPKFFSQLSEPTSEINNYGSGFYGSGIYYGYTSVYGSRVYGERTYT